MTELMTLSDIFNVITTTATVLLVLAVVAAPFYIMKRREKEGLNKPKGENKNNGKSRLGPVGMLLLIALWFILSWVAASTHELIVGWIVLLIVIIITVYLATKYKLRYAD